MNRGVLTREGGRCTIHFTAHLSIYGAVERWCEDLAHQIWSNVCDHGEIRRKGDRTAISKTQRRKKWILWFKHHGGMMKQWETACVCTFKFLKNWRKKINSRKLVESAGFMRRVSIGMHHATIHDMNDGFQGTTAAC